MTMMLAQIGDTLQSLDFVVVGIYLVLTIGIGVSFAKKGTQNMRSFFIGGSSMPWWLVGISLLAACFAADTPLWIGSVIYKRGIEGAWFFWANGIGIAFYILTIAPLWRRTGVMTELEFFEMRYTGKGAAFLRGFNSVWTSLFVNIMMMAVSTLSIAKILQASIEFPGLSDGQEKLLCVVITMGIGLTYCAVSGLWGVCATDLLQFFVTFFGSLMLAGFAIYKAGGIEAIVTNVSDSDWVGRNLNIFPNLNDALGLPAITVIFLFGLKWLEQTGMGAYVAQKLFAAKTPKQSVYTALVWGSLYFSVIPLPWIITIVASKVMLPGLLDGQEAYPRMAMAVLPLGLRGVLIASLIAAFMSTYASLLNWGSSYFVNDFYRRFLNKSKEDHHYVRVAQFIMIPMAIAAGIIAFLSQDIINLLFIPLAFGAGGTTLALCRWMWWRPNQWSEVASTLGSLIVTFIVMVIFPNIPFIQNMAADNFENLTFGGKMLAVLGAEEFFGPRMLAILLGTLIIWVTVTMLTTPVPEEKLNRFYKKVRPPLFWGPVRKRLGMGVEISFLGVLYGWFTLIVTIFCPLVGLLKIFFGNAVLGIILVAAGVVGLILTVQRANRIYAEVEAKPEESSEKM